MGSRGPVPLSLDALTTRGSSLTARRRKAEQGGRAVAKADRLHCPSWLGAEAKAEWRRAVAALEPFGILRPTDATALGRYCELWTLWRKLVEARDAASDPNDPTCIRLERRALKVSASLLAMEQQFGMTPASRARLGLPLQVAPPTMDPRERFFARILPPRCESN